MVNARYVILFSIILIGLSWAAVDSTDYSCANCLLQLSSGRAHSCAVRDDGSITCWGGDLEGESTPPDLPPANYDFLQVEAGRYHTCAVVSCSPGGGVTCPLGNVRCWGRDDDGQASPGIDDIFSMVSTGGSHSCGVRIGGAVECWGQNVFNQATPPSPPFNSVFTQVSGGELHTCAVSDCTEDVCPPVNVTCWGDDFYGQTSVPGPVALFSQVSAGKHHTCAIGRDDGVVQCWGLDVDGQATPPLGSFIQVSAGALHTCGVMTDRSVACWGYDYSGQATPPSGSFRQVAAGNNHTCGIRSDGSVSCWGSGSQNQALPTAGLCGLFHDGLELGDDCRWSNGSLPCWTADCDGDGYVSPESAAYCVSTPMGVPAECPNGGWIEQSAVCGAYDCMDDNAAVYSGQETWNTVGYGLPGGPLDRFDYNCDGEEEQRYRWMSSSLCCMWGSQGCEVLFGPPGCELPGWYETTVPEVPECGETADYLVCETTSTSLCAQVINQVTQSCR